MPNKATLFAKTALLINDEHPSTIVTQSRPRYYPGDELAWANTYMPLQWYAGGKERPVLQQITWDAFKKFGVPVEFDPSPAPPAGDARLFLPLPAGGRCQRISQLFPYRLGNAGNGAVDRP